MAQSISSDLSSLTGLLCTDFQHKTAWCFVEVLVPASNSDLLPLRSPATCKLHLVPHATIACLHLCSPGIRSCGVCEAWKHEAQSAVPQVHTFSADLACMVNLTISACLPDLLRLCSQLRGLRIACAAGILLRLLLWASCVQSCLPA